LGGYYGTMYHALGRGRTARVATTSSSQHRRHSGWSRARGQSDSNARELETSPRATSLLTLGLLGSYRQIFDLLKGVRGSIFEDSFFSLTPVLYKRKLADFFTFFCTHDQKNWKSKIVGQFSLLKLLFQK